MKKTQIQFEEDKGVARASVARFNVQKVEGLLAGARRYLDEHKGARPAKLDLIKIEQMLGVAISNSNNFAWMFNPSNKHAPFKELATKYNIKVGAHRGTKKNKEEQSNYFREMTEAENER